MSEEIEIILKELLYGDITYDFEVYKNDLMEDINALESFTLSYLLDKCIYYEISPIFIYLLLPKLSDKSLELIFEITLLRKNDLLSADDFLECFDLICSEKKSLSEICKMVLLKLKIILTPKSQKKNALFLYSELLFGFNSLPILDSGSCLTKDSSSLKIRPSTLFPYCYKISLETVKLCLNSLKNSSSRMIIFSTLIKIGNLYNSEEKIKEVISSIDFKTIKLSELRDKIVEIEDCLNGNFLLVGASTN